MLDGLIIKQVKLNNVSNSVAKSYLYMNKLNEGFPSKCEVGLVILAMSPETLGDLLQIGLQMSIIFFLDILAALTYM